MHKIFQMFVAMPIFSVFIAQISMASIFQIDETYCFAQIYIFVEIWLQKYLISITGEQSKMSDRMQKDAFDKFINNIKNISSSGRHYTPSPYPYYSHSPYVLPNMQAMREKEHDKKMPLISEHQPYSPSSLYNYSAYPPYGMNYPGAAYSMEVEQPQQHKNNHEEKMRGEHSGHIKNGYGSYYHPLMHPSQPYSPYSYYPYNSMYSNYGYPRGEGLFSSQRIVNNPTSHSQSPFINHKEKQKKNSKSEIIILSDSQEKIDKKKKEKFQNVIDVQKNQNEEIRKCIPINRGKKIVEEPKQPQQVSNDPFYIKKKHKITKSSNEKTKNISPLIPQKTKDEPSKDKPSRYNIMPAEIYQEMVKKQSQIGLEMFLQRQRQKLRDRQNEKDKYSEKMKTSRNRQQNNLELPLPTRQKTKKSNWENQINFANQEYEKQIKRFSQKITGMKDDKDLIKNDQKPTQKKEEKQSAKKQENEQLKKKASQSITPLVSDEKDGKKERIRDDHPLKQLRYSESHGRIRLGPYFQSSIPNLVTVQQAKLIKMRLQNKLKERQISAITF